MSAHAIKSQNDQASGPSKQTTVTPSMMIIAQSASISMAMSLLRKAEQPGVRREEFMKATQTASRTAEPEVHLAALQSSNRTIKLGAWRNPNLYKLGRRTIEAKLEEVPKDDRQILDLGQYALRHCESAPS